jgi:hypothetical protein
MRHPHLTNVLPLGKVMGKRIYARRPEAIELVPPVAENVGELRFIGVAAHASASLPTVRLSQSW